MAFEFLGKDAVRRPEHARGAVGMTASPTPGEQTRPALNALEVARRRRQSGDAPGGRRDGAQPEGARPALAGAFMGEVRQDSRGLHDTASSRRKHRYHAAAERIPLAAQRFGVERQPPCSTRLDPPTEISTEQYRVGIRCDAARGIDDVGECQAEWDLDQHRLGNGAADGDERGPGRVPDAEGAKPFIAESRDHRDVSERLDILHQRRTAVDPALVRTRWDRRGERYPSVDEVHRGGLLAGNVANRCAHQTDPSALGSGTLGDCAVHRLDRTCMVGADVQDDVIGADRTCGEDRSVDDEVRTLLHEHAILPAQGFSLTAVGEHDRGTRILRSHRSPFGGNRKPGPTLATQVAALDRIDEPGSPVWQHAEATLMLVKTLHPVRTGRAGEQRDAHRPDPNDARSAATRRSSASGSGGAATARQMSATPTATTQTPSIASIQSAVPSVPVPTPWSTASGQLAYASQWIDRHTRAPMCLRSRLVATIAS